MANSTADRPRLNAAGVMLLAVASIQAIQILYWIAWMRPLWPMPRFPGMAQNPNNQAFILLVGLVYAVQLRRPFWIYSGLALLLLTGSRVNLGAAFFGLILFLIFDPEIRSFMLRPLPYLGVIAYMAVAFAGPISLMQSSTGGTVIIPATPIMRLELYKVAWELWKVHPIFGSGSGSFKIFLEERIFHLSDPYVYSHAHSLWLHTMAEFGLVGLSGWLLGAFELCRRAIHQLGENKPAGAALLGAVLFSVTFDYYFWFLPTVIVLALVAHQILWSSGNGNS